ALNSGRIFSSRLSYNKGSMVLVMLRWKLGEEVFFQAIENYLADPNLAFKYATTADLKTHLEAASGQDLGEFFNDWVYNQGYPTYSVTMVNSTPGQVQITLNQTQSHPSVSFFEMPVPLRVFGSGGQVLDLVLNNTFNRQVFNQNIPFEVSSIAFDPDIKLISRNNATFLGTPNFELLKNVKLSPNPATNLIAVSLPENVVLKNAVFHNILGQVVQKSETQTSWDISKLSPGVHFITLVTDSGTTQLK